MPSSPTGRVPQWVLDEAAGHPTTPIPWRAELPPVPRRRRRRRLRSLLAVVAVLAVGLGAAFLAEPGRWPWEPRVEVAAPQPPSDPSSRSGPLPGVEAAPAPLGSPPPPPPEGGPHGFVTLQADGVTPVAYDPCRPLHYTIQAASAPAGGEELVRGAVDRLAEATGLQFVYDGPTDEAAVAERPAFQPDRYGDRWAPVLIDWQTEEENPDLAGDLVGEAGSAAASLGDGPLVFVTGTVTLDATQLPGILEQEDGVETVRAIVLHELGHLVGLAHVDDATQLMYPETRSGVTDFAAGDLTGLARLGSGPCVPEL